MKVYEKPEIEEVRFTPTESITVEVSGDGVGDWEEE